MTAPSAGSHAGSRRGVDLPISADRAWALVADVRNHPRWVLSTRVDAPGDLQVGDLISTAVGPRSWGGGLADRMRVERLDPPSSGEPGRADGVVVLRRVGPALHRSREIRVRPTGPTTCHATWSEHVHLAAGPPWLTAPLLWPVQAYVASRARRRLLAEMRKTRR